MGFLCRQNKRIENRQGFAELKKQQKPGTEPGREFLEWSEKKSLPRVKAQRRGFAELKKQQKPGTEPGREFLEWSEKKSLPRVKAQRRDFAEL